jgi:uncharacterized membrane protein
MIIPLLYLALYSLNNSILLVYPFVALEIIIVPVAATSILGDKLTWFY